MLSAQLAKLMNHRLKERLRVVNKVESYWKRYPPLTSGFHLYAMRILIYYTHDREHFEAIVWNQSQPLLVNVTMTIFIIDEKAAKWLF